LQQCGLDEGNTAQLLSMSVIAGWSIYEGLLTNILQTHKMEKKRKKVLTSHLKPYQLPFLKKRNISVSIYI